MHFRVSSPKHRHHFDEDPATVRSVNLQRLKSVSARLASTVCELQRLVYCSSVLIAIDILEAARNIISVIQRREIVHRLDFGDSSLGDAGCVLLFGFLESPAGRRCRNSLTELYLTRNGIGAKGLLAVSKFLKDNHVLRELCLSGNPLSNNADVIAIFTAALNSSRLCTLQLIHNDTLSDTFICAFLPKLRTQYLRQLDLSAISLTRVAVPIIIEYVTSPRCRLDRLQCNANSLTLLGARKIINAIESKNYSIVKVNLEDLHVIEHDVDGEERTLAWQEGWRILNNAMQRNMRNKMLVKTQAVALLLYSRALFLRSSMRDTLGDAPAFTSVSASNRLSTSVKSHAFSPLPMFASFPAEIQQEIIALLAPELSHRQRMRVIAFAADIQTLPQLDNPNLEPVNTAYLPAFMRARFTRKTDPTTNMPYEGSWRPPAWWECACPEDDRRRCHSLRRCVRERRDVWLTRVGCDIWEPEFTTRDDDL